MNILILGQIIGFLAFFLEFLGLINKKDNKLIILTAGGAFLWGIHYSFLGLFGAAGINFIDVIKNILGIKFERNKFIFYIFVGIYILIGVTSYSNNGDSLSLLATFGGILGVIAVFWFRGIMLRLTLISANCVWLIHNYLGNSYAGMTSDIILILAAFYGIYKLYNH